MAGFQLTTPTLPGGVADEAEIDFFGTDILFENDDIQITASGDYAEIGGYLALRQAIKIRLIVSPGEYATQPDFGVGLPLYVKKRASQADLDDLRQKIINQLSKEERIEKIDSVTVERADLSADKTGIKVLIKVTAFGRENAFAFKAFTE